jgi:hypothetical protein
MRAIEAAGSVWWGPPVRAGLTSAELNYDVAQSPNEPTLESDVFVKERMAVGQSGVRAPQFGEKFLGLAQQR